MVEAMHPKPLRREISGQVREALDHLEELVVEGLKHGFFNCTIACQIAHGGRRELLIGAGKSHKFTIPPEDLMG